MSKFSSFPVLVEQDNYRAILKFILFSGVRRVGSNWVDVGLY